jgi:hypothetical protein
MVDLIVITIAVELIALYFFISFITYAIGERFSIANIWLSFIPGANVYIMLRIAKLPWWLIFFLILSIIPGIGTIIFGFILIYIWWKIAERLGKPGWWSLLLMVPIANIVIIAIMAWGKDAPAPAQV